MSATGPTNRPASVSRLDQMAIYAIPFPDRSGGRNVWRAYRIRHFDPIACSVFTRRNLGTGAASECRQAVAGLGYVERGAKYLRRSGQRSVCSDRRAFELGRTTALVF